MNKLSNNPNFINRTDILNFIANLSNDEVFTPPKIVNQMLDLLPQELWSNKDAKFLDPMSKSGVFLREIAKRLMKGLAQQFPDKRERVNHIMQHQLFGIAVTDLTALISRRTLYCNKKANRPKHNITTVFTNEEGNIYFNKDIKHEWKGDTCKWCGASKGVYDRTDGKENYAYNFIHTENPLEYFNNMKFDVIIGNPPYQLSDGGHGVSAKPIYQKFVEAAKKLEPRYLCMIIPARWYAGGKGLDDFREDMLNDDRLRVIVDYQEANEVFPGVQIKGGICYFLWDRNNRGLCKVYNMHKNEITSISDRPLLEKDAKTFVRYNNAIQILKKIQNLKEKSLFNQISARKPFGFDTLFKGEDFYFNDSVVIYRNGGFGYVKKEEIKINRETIDKFKVFIPPLGSGSDSFPHMILGKPFIGEPNTVCSETYIVVGVYEKEINAENLISYLKTKFLRFLVLLNKPTQHATRSVYQFVPIQDFSKPWTDAELYAKYGLNEEEIAFIESMIKPME